MADPGFEPILTAEASPSPEAVAPLASQSLPMGSSLRKRGEGGGTGLCLGLPLPIGPSPRPTGPQIVLQKTMIYKLQPDTFSLYLPTIKQRLVVTNGPHAHGTTAPGTLPSSADLCS